ncbi:PhlD [Streptomyces sp. NPDC015350]|uniref:PhlD n=1 Tax=Streptomyces sp. NPDC015350 TaxID=3364955 RepID=UPI0036FD7C08
MAFVNCPGVADAPHLVTTEEIAEYIQGNYSEHPRLPSFMRISETIGVKTRRFVRPLSEVATQEDFRTRNERAYANVAKLAEQAARKALHESGLTGRQIGGLITFHATGLAVPGLDAYLVSALDLREDILRIPMTQVACAGGAHALALAAKLTCPDTPILVVGAEELSSAWQQGDTDLPAMIWKLLFGDGAAAAVVSAEPLRRPGAVIEDTWFHLLKNSRTHYQLMADEVGFHFESTPAALRAVSETLQQLPWLQDQQTWNPEFGVIHPGGPRILDHIASHGGCPEEALRHSRASLAENGNTGGSAVLRILARIHEEPPPPNATGLLLGLGPGFCAAASRIRWTAQPATASQAPCPPRHP